jgi:hypothetical protein
MLEQFFTGVLNQLQAEIDLINSIVPHSVTKGSLNEESFRRIMESFLPIRYAVGTGIVIDSHGNRSSQVDLLLYDKLNSSKLFKHFSQVIFPIETVFACIEVKTKISKSGLIEIADENLKISQLKHSLPVLRSFKLSSTTPNAIDFSEYVTRPPMTYLVSYQTQTNNPLTVRGWFENCSNKEFLPDMSLFLDLGMVVFRPKPKEKQTFNYLITPARHTDTQNPNEGIVYLDRPNADFMMNGRIYRSSYWKGNGGYPIIMPEKALLSFLIQLSRAADAFPKSDSFDPTPYLAKNSDEGLDVVDSDKD